MKPVAVIFNDLHLKTGNEEAVKRSIIHMIEYMVAEKIEIALFAGDWFHSRSFQRQALLILTDELLNRFRVEGIQVHMIPGNHDKTLYGSTDSFLRVFKHHPCISLYSTPTQIQIEDLSITMMPFMDDATQVKWIDETEGADILISHFEMQGSTNLGHVSEKASITRKTLKKWDKVYLGHYHNHHEITQDIVHLPSIRQNNFGEDDYKGFSLLYPDGSYEIVQGSFSKYVKKTYNVDELDTKTIKKEIAKYSESQDSVRFEFTGSESALKGINKALFKGTGIDFKLKYEARYEVGKTVEPELVERYDDENIKKLFIEFCKEKGYNHAEGKEYLEEFLTNKSV